MPMRWCVHDPFLLITHSCADCLQKEAMDATLASITVDPTAQAAEEEIDVPGVTDEATNKVLRKAAKKAEKKRKSTGEDGDVEMADGVDEKAARRAEKKRRKLEGDAGVGAEVDEEALKKQLKKDKKAKRQSEDLAKGEVPVEQIGKKKKSKA